MRGIEHLAVDIELPLASGGVADADGTRATIALEMRQDLLRQITAAVEPIQHLNRVLAGEADRLEPFEKVECLFVVADALKRVQNEGGIAQPRVAVIPIAHAADFFR